MKTYFMAWESNEKRGHSIYEFSNDIAPRDALSTMIDNVKNEFGKSIKEVITATQFNLVT